MAWSSPATIMNAVSVAGTEQNSSEVTLNPGESAVVQIYADFPTTPTDELVVKLYGRIDGTNWDNVPFTSFRMPNTPDPGQFSFQVSGFKEFRVGAVRSGSTDTITTTIKYIKDGINI